PFVDSTIDSEGGVLSGGHVMGKWEHAVSDASTVYFRSYINNARRYYTELGTNTTSFDNEFQHIWTPGNNHAITWGLGFRYIAESIHTGRFFNHFNRNKDNTLYTA